jgi:hypothetical protein
MTRRKYLFLGGINITPNLIYLCTLPEPSPPAECLSEVTSTVNSIAAINIFNFFQE